MDPVLAAAAPPCVWMSAGVLRYRLCARDFDCERCLLDAALRAGQPSETPDPMMLLEHVDGMVARDRLYAPGHIWLKRLGGDGPADAWRLGLDAFGAALLGTPLAVTCGEAPGELHRGRPFCTVVLEAGPLSLSSPVEARRTRGNDALGRDPRLLLREPYGEGWIAELTEVDPRDVRDLRPPIEACAEVHAELCRFREAVALALLAGDRTKVPALALLPGGLTDLASLLGADRYLAVLRDLVH